MLGALGSSILLASIMIHGMLFVILVAIRIILLLLRQLVSVLLVVGNLFF